MKDILLYIKRNWKYLLIYLIIFLLCIVKLPYYIDAPGGLINVGDRVEIENQYESEGSLNLAYVTEYSATIPMVILSYFNKDWKLNKISSKEEKKNYNESVIRDKLWIKEAYSNAVILAYEKASKKVLIKSEEIYVLYILEGANTDLKIGDKILDIDGIKVSSKNDLAQLLKDKKMNDRIKMKVINNNKEYNRYAVISEIDGVNIIGFVPAEIREYDVDPKISVHYESTESGPSGGLMISLAIYNALVKDDITGGLKIVGTGTIDKDGNVGEIGGVEYKIKGAVKEKADLFFIPAGDNYEEARKIVEKNNYKIKLVPVSSFDEALLYLKENVMK